MNSDPPAPPALAKVYTGDKPAEAKAGAAKSMLPRRSLRPILMVTALLGALVLLAVLQYRWSGQVSEGERLRMQSSLQLTVDQFRREFSRDLLAIGTSLQADREAVESEDWKPLAQAQSEWLSAASAAQFVSAVYVLEPGGKLLQLRPAASAYVEAAPPADLQPVTARLTESFDERRPGFPRNSAWALDGQGPVLIHAISPGPGRDREGDRPPASGPPPERRPTFQLITLNREALSKKLLADLATRHFGIADGSFLYQAQVYKTAEMAVPIYNSSGAPILKSTDADIDIDLIDMRPRGGPDRGTRDRPRFGFGGWRGGRGREGRGGPPDMDRPGGRGPAGDSPSADMRGEMFRGFAASPILMSDGVSPWHLAVRHRAGSVSTAVATLRWRNLAVSFAILLVLGLSMVTIVRNTQRSQRLAELQMEFVAGVSHELRTPLAVISSAAENLTDGVVQGETQVKQYGSLICNESRRLAGMMEQILQFAAGQKRPPYKPVTLQIPTLVEDALALSQSVLTEGGFTVEQHVSPNLPAVRGESGALTQCLQNLISNAAKYSGSSRWIGLRATADAGWVSVEVEDHGIGIEKSDLPHLFDAFYRAKSVRSEQIHGTGLGLNLARSFARDAAGDITVESTAGQGSRFTLRLPAHSEAQPA